MAGKSVAQKLVIRPGATVWTSTDEDLARLGPLPEGVRRVSALRFHRLALDEAQFSGR